jgi:hypothetical protein
MLRRVLVLALLVQCAILAGGCFNPFSPKIAPTAGVYVPAPSPSTAAGVVRLLEWCWRNRDIDYYRQLFTDDYQFIFALKDSSGSLTRDPPLNRETELTTAKNLFVGGASAPAATNITLNLDPTLNPQADSRPGKDAVTHKEILTSVDLAIRVEGGREYRISGYARYFVVRGDVASIPKELKDRGFAADSNRWYIERWNDETLGEAPASARPAVGLTALRRAALAPWAVGTARAQYADGPEYLTLSELKALYRNPY